MSSSDKVEVHARTMSVTEKLSPSLNPKLVEYSVLTRIFTTKGA